MKRTILPIVGLVLVSVLAFDCGNSSEVITASDAAGTCEAGAGCDDGNPCTMNDWCDDDGFCQGEGYDCPEGNACAGFSCDGAGACIPDVVLGTCFIDDECYAALEGHADNLCLHCNPEASQSAWSPNDGNACDDGNPCSVDDACVDGSCAGGGELDCDDSNSCTADTCDPKVGCVVENLTDPCDDGNPCTADDVCGDGSCVGLLKDCDDDNPCTSDTCDTEDGECTFTPESGPCDDGNSCTVADWCEDGNCVGEDVCPCETDEACAPYEDGNLCNGVFYCDQAVYPYTCKVDLETVVVCDVSQDGQCEETLCVPATGACEPQPVDDGTWCDDGNGCTVGETCQQGQCAGASSICECESDEDCQIHEDGDLCNGTLVCDLEENACVVDLETVVVCDTSQDDQCENTVCIPDTGVCEAQAVDNGLWCDDGNGCTVGDTCQAGFCTGGASICECQSNEECATYDDGDFCNGTLFCDLEAYPHTCKVDLATIVLCDDSLDGQCEKTVCEPETGACAPQAVQDGLWCDDGNSCTVNDTCKVGNCAGGASVCECEADEECTAFEDGDLCNGSLWCDTTDYPYACKVDPTTVVNCDTSQDGQCEATICEPETGICMSQAVVVGAWCDDGSICTVNDTCQGGICLGGASVCECEADEDCGDFEDDDFCNGTLQCDTDSYPFTCEVAPETVVVCDVSQDDQCSKTVCDPASGNCEAVAVADDLWCDDGNGCTVNDTCQSGICVAGISACECEIDDDCAVFEDDDLCNGTLRCDKDGYPYQCVVATETIVACDVSQDDQCEKTVCEPADGNCGVLAVPDGTWCTDGNGCTVNDSCQDGFCLAGASVCECEDDEDCGDFEDDDLCNGTLFCDVDDYPYECKVDPNTVVGCDDSQDTACKVNACAPDTGQCAMADLGNGIACSDGDACTLYDACQDGVCASGLDFCDCHTDEDCLAQDDGDLCNGVPACDTDAFPKECVPAPETAVVCDESLNTECTIQACEPSSGQCGAVQANEGQPCDGGGQNACVGGECACQPACAGKECGDDGCGSFCGVCNQYANSFCDGIACGCTPDCDGKVCGDNGCGDSCGACTDPFVCSANACVSGCPDGVQPCNNVCVEYETDPVNCGSCGTICKTTDPAKLGVCDGVCGEADCPADHWNLNGQPGDGCEYSCTSGGAETCNDADDDCDGETDEDFDLDNSLLHCGACDAGCAPEHAEQFACVAGSCTILTCAVGYKDINGNAEDGCETPYKPGGELWVDSWNIGDPAEDGSELHPFSTIQKAIDSAFEGYLIHVKAGYYAGGNVVDIDLLTIRGVALDDVNVSNSPSATGILVEADGVTIENMKIYGGHIGIHFHGTNSDNIDDGDVSNVEIYSMAGTGTQSGILLDYANLVDVNGVNFHDLDGAVGIRANNSGSCTFSANAFTDLYVGNNTTAGVYLNSSQLCTVSSSTFSALTGGRAVVGVYGTNATACTFDGNTFTNLVGGPGDNKSNDPYVGGTGRVAAGIYLTNSADNAITDNEFDKICGGVGGDSGNNGTGGSGGVGAGVYLTGTTVDSHLTGNTLTDIQGGAAGKGGWQPGLAEHGFGIHMNATSIHNTVDMDNTLDGVAIIYRYAVDTETVQGLDLSAAGNPTNWGKMVAVASSEVQFLNNTVSAYTSEIGMSAAGIRFVDCTICTASGNTISDINGGQGISGYGGGSHRTGGPGGLAAGLYLDGATDCVISDNQATGIAGGKGGTCSYAGSGGTGGLGIGLYLADSSGCTFGGNVLEATAGLGGATNEYGRPGADQQAFGVYFEADALQNSFNLTNTFQAETIAYVYGGTGTVVQGLDLSAAFNTTNLGKIVAVEATDVQILDNTVAGMTGEAGQSGNSDQVGKLGEIGAGIRIYDCTGAVVSGNTISDVAGGVGGTGGFDRDGGPGNRGYGIYVLNSTDTSLLDNQVTGTLGGKGGGGGYDHSGGAGGGAAGVFLTDSTGSDVTGNVVEAITGGQGGQKNPQGGSVGGGGPAFGYDLINLATTTFENNIAWKIFQFDSNDADVSTACFRLRTSDTVKIRNCTCHDSGLDGLGNGHGVWLDGVYVDAVQLIDSIIFDVAGYCMFSDAQNGPMTLTAVYSDISTCAEGQASNAALAGTCIDADPLFVDAAAGNFHLQQTSPCIDTGKPTTDCSDEPAPNGCAVNMGAYGNTGEAASKVGASNCTPCPTP